MKSRVMQYAVLIGGIVLVCGSALVLVFAEVLSVQSGMISVGLFWLWNGFCLMMDWHPEYRQWDCWERQAYGLALLVVGGLWTVMSFTPLSRQWLPCILSIVPPILIALVGRFWYVERKRSEEWKKQNQTEKD